MRTGVTREQKERDFAEWEIPLAAAKKGKRQQKPEDLLHFSVASYMRRAIGHEGWFCPPGIVWWSYESRNAGKGMVTKDGRKINLEGINRKNRGCIAGLPDVCVLFLGRIYGIELKAGKNGTSDKQDELHGAWKAAGADVAVCWTLDHVEAALRRWGVPLKAGVGA